MKKPANTLPRDPSQRAKRILDLATGDEDPAEEESDAQKFGREGGTEMPEAPIAVSDPLRVAPVPSLPPAASSEPQQAGVQPNNWNLGGGVYATLSVNSAELDQEQLDLLKDHVDLFVRAESRRLKKVKKETPEG